MNFGKSYMFKRKKFSIIYATLYLLAINSLVNATDDLSPFPVENKTQTNFFGLDVRGEFDLDFTSFSHNPPYIFNKETNKTELKTSNKNGGFAVRRALLDFRGKLEQDFKYRVEVDVTSINLRKAYLEYVGIKNTSIKLGKYFAIFGLGNCDLMMEQPLRAGIGFIDSTGLHVSSYGPNWFASSGITVSDPIIKDDAKNEDKRVNLFARAGINHTTHDDKIIHGAISIVKIRPIDHKGDKPYQHRYRAKPEAFISNDFINHDFSDLKNMWAYDLEAAYLHGPLYVQGEYINSTYNYSKDNDNFYSYYVQAGWMINGAQRVYKKYGTIELPEITDENEFDFDKNQYGSFEITSRYSYLNMNGKKNKAGAMRVASIGLNWYINKYITSTLDYSMAKTDSHASTPKADPKLMMFRVHIAF